jgi:phosphoglycolate phosphatase
VLYKAVIFDLDGTLLDTLADIANCMNSVLQKHNLPIRPTENYKNYVGEGMTKLVENVLEDIYVSEQEKAILLGEMNLEYAQNWMNETKPYAGIAELFSALSIYGNALKIGVLSNKPDAFTKQMVKFYFPDVPFSQIRGAIENIPKKPNPQAVVEMAEVWGIST